MSHRLQTHLLIGLLMLIAASAASAQTTTVTLVHGVPGTGLGLDPELPVDVHLSGLGCALTDFRFGQDVGPLDLPAGTYDVEIRLRDVDAGDCGGGIAIAVPGLPLLEGENSTVVAHLDESGAPTASKFVNDLTRGEPGDIRLSVRHLAEAPAVDLVAYRIFSADRDYPEFNGVVNGQEGTVDTGAGFFVVTIAPAGGSPIAYELLLAKADESIGFHAVGSLADGTFRAIVTTQDQVDDVTIQTTTLSVLHGIPGADLGLDPELPVDVWVSGLGCAIQDFRFGDRVQGLEIPADVYDIEVRLAEDGTAPCDGGLAIDAKDVPLNAGENNTVVAHLTEAGAPTASLFANDVSSAGRYKGRIAVHHTAAAPSVDVSVRKRLIFFGYQALKLYGVSNGDAAAEELRPSHYDVMIGLPAERPIFRSRVRVESRELVSVYAVGSLTAGTFELLEVRQPISR